MPRPVDLCIIAEYFHPVLSGAAERFRRYLPGLRKRGIDARVFTVWHEGLAQEEMIDGALVQRLSLPPTDLHPSAELTRQTLRYLKSTGKWPDVVHILSHTLQGVQYLWQMRLRGLPCVNSITMNPVNPVTTPVGKINYWLHQWLRYGVFNQVIVSSQVIAQSAQKGGISSRRIKVIANGIDTKRFQPLENIHEKQLLRQALGFNMDDVIVLFVGFISYRKGVDLLLEAWPLISALHPRAKLVIIGSKDRQNQFTAEFEHIMSGLSSSSITCLEPVPNIEAYMQIADMLILPSRLEGMPNVVLEGMACALPCVLTPFYGLPETFGRPGVDYLLTSYVPKLMAADVNALIADRVLRQVIGQSALKRARTVLNVELSLDLHAELYHYWAAKLGRRAGTGS